MSEPHIIPRDIGQLDLDLMREGKLIRLKDYVDLYNCLPSSRISISQGRTIQKTLKPGDMFLILDCTKKWWRILCANKIGWIYVVGVKMVDITPLELK